MQFFKLLLTATVSEDAFFMNAEITIFTYDPTLCGYNQAPPATLATYEDAIVWVGYFTLVRISKGLYGRPHPQAG